MSSDMDDTAMTAESARADLAFMRSLVQGGGGWQLMSGEAYMCAGLIYGLQCLGHSAQGLGWLPGEGLAALALGIGPTVLFCLVMVWIVIRHRGAPQGGVVAQAVRNVFGTLGMANLAMIVIIGSVALRLNSLMVWMIYPCIVFLMQGVAWVVVYGLRKERWLLVVGLGWAAAAVALSQLLESPALPLFFAITLFALMVIPGAMMIRLARQGR